MLAMAIFIFISYSSSADLVELVGTRHALGQNLRVLQQLVGAFATARER